MRIFRIETDIDYIEAMESLDAVAIRPDCVQSKEALELAFHLAKSSFEDKKNIARKLKFEFLLWLSGTRDIKNALKKTAPKSKEMLLIVFSNSKDVLVKLKAKKKSLKLKDKAEPLALERISLGRI